MKRRKVRVAAWLLCSWLTGSVGGIRGAGAEGYPALISAIRTGDAGRVGELIGDGAALKATDARGNSALHWAALAGDSALVSRLLDAGLNPNATNAAGATPLHYATGEASSVRALLRAGARVDVRSLAGSTPLLTATPRPGGAEAVRLLIEAGADVRVGRPLFGSDMISALTLAAGFGDESAVELLLERGAAPSGEPGIPAMAVAASTGRTSLLGALLRRGAALDFDDGFAGHSLNNAFYGGHTALAAFLIEQGADLHRSSSFGERVPPMVWAAYNELGDLWAARALLARGVDPNERTGSGHTALDWALKRGETPLVALLRSHGGIESAPVREKKLPGNSVPTEPAAREAAIREAAQRAIDLLQRSSDRFLETGIVREQNCVSCHHQTLPAVAYGLARERGLRVDEVSLARQVKAQRDSWAPTDRDPCFGWGPSLRSHRPLALGLRSIRLMISSCNLSHCFALCTLPISRTRALAV